jgi:hypothetical protein
MTQQNNLEFKNVLITPAIAKDLLQQNISNRKISKPKLKQYANDMSSDKWKPNTAEFIKIAKSGLILDGQHRLQAIILANYSGYFWVAYNVNENVFDVLDTGKTRNASDVFIVGGIKNSNAIPSIMAQYNALQEKRRYNVQLNQKKTNAELLEQYHEDPEFWQKVAVKSYSWYLCFAKILQPSIIGGFYAHTYNFYPELANSFMEQLTTGMDVSNKAILLLRTKLMQDKMSPRKMTMDLKVALIIKTFNYFIDNKCPSILKFDTISEKYPTIKTP